MNPLNPLNPFNWFKSPDRVENDQFRANMGPKSAEHLDPQSGALWTGDATRLLKEGDGDFRSVELKSPKNRGPQIEPSDFRRDWEKAHLPSDRVSLGEAPPDSGAYHSSMFRAA